MQKGDEPLRSFGDLMQFYSPPSGAEEAKAEKPAKKKKKVDVSKPADDGAANSASPTPDADTQAAVVDTSGADTGSVDKETPSVPAQSAEPAKQVEPAPQIEPTPPTAEQDGSDSTQASDKPAS